MPKKIRYWFEYIFVALCARIVPLVPLRLLHGLVATLGWLVYYLDRRSRLVALANLAAVFGDQYPPRERARIASRSVQAFGGSFLELFWTPRLNRQNIHRFVRFADEKRFEAMLNTKQEHPVIGITAHFGNFESGSALVEFLVYDGYILLQPFQ